MCFFLVVFYVQARACPIQCEHHEYHDVSSVTSSKVGVVRLELLLAFTSFQGRSLGDFPYISSSLTKVDGSKGDKDKKLLLALTKGVPS